MAGMAQIMVIPILAYTLLSLTQAHPSNADYQSHDPNVPFKIDPTDPHGGVPMGIPNNFCDNGEDYIQIDWDPNSKTEYTCTEATRQSDKTTKYSHCSEKAKMPIHKCFPERLVYDEDLPTSGPHRPLWPIYGEYVYLPPQRWLHSLEHGAAVFLYHPCADKREIELFKAIAKSCLHRIVISPYKKMPPNVNFAVLTWKCKLTLGYPDILEITNFVKAHALQAPEGSVTKDGQYHVGLIERAGFVSDATDSLICPDTLITTNTANLIRDSSKRRLNDLAVLEQELMDSMENLRREYRMLGLGDDDDGY